MRDLIIQQDKINDWDKACLASGYAEENDFGGPIYNGSVLVNIIRPLLKD